MVNAYTVMVECHDGEWIVSGDKLGHDNPLQTYAEAHEQAARFAAAGLTVRVIQHTTRPHVDDCCCCYSKDGELWDGPSRSRKDPSSYLVDRSAARPSVIPIR
jgi:hypothetical protein